MRGISEEKLRKIIAGSRGNIPEHLLISCQELQEPWIPIDAFLKSGFEGLCWIEFPSEIITDAYFDGYLFKHSSTSDFAHDENYIVRVMPIYKPEPPK